MRFYKNIFCAILIIVACRKTSVRQQDTATVELNSCITTNLSQGLVNICLDSVQDSRCPKNVLYVWKGTAFAKFSMTINHQTHHFNLGLDKGFSGKPKDTVIQNISISFLNLYPYPGDSASVKPYAELHIQ